MPSKDGKKIEPKTYFANERTYLAWLRSGLTALACLLLAGFMSITMSSQWMVFRLAVAQADMRGDTDESWLRTVDWLVRNRLKG